MDPNATCQRIASAAKRDDQNEVIDALLDLVGWLTTNGRNPRPAEWRAACDAACAMIDTGDDTAQDGAR